jgi:hypothetical protein
MAMPEPKFSSPQLTGQLPGALAQDDDIPQTFRRERDAREKEAREREAKARDAREREIRARDTKAAQTYPAATDLPHDYTLPDIREVPRGVVVSALKIPFLRLMAFFIKAVFAAIPALLILIGLLWGIGQIAQTYFPWLIKMRILIQFP